MNKYIRFLILFTFSLCCFWLTSCTPKVPDEAEIVIISFNDLHGDFENMPQLSAFVNEMRNTYKYVIVVDAGDRFTGNPFNDFYERPQFPIIDMQNHIGVDVAVIGNHEFDNGVAVLNERIKDATSVAVSANIELETSGLVGVRPYYMINKNGIRIAFLGLTNVDRQTGRPSALADHLVGMRFFDPIETALNFRHLRKKSHVFVALTHIGITEDSILAEAMPELDVIIGGHSHSVLEEPMIQNGVLITQAGRSARHVGKTKIRLEKGVITEISNRLINLRTWDGPIDSVIVKKIERYSQNPFLTTAFVTLRHDIPNLLQLGHVMTDAPRTLPNVDFSLMNCSGIRINHLDAGEITYADVFRVSPFGNYLVVVDLTPAEIRALIEIEFTDKRNCLMIPSGFEYTAIRTPGDNIQVTKMTYPNGQKLDETKKYRLILNNYLVATYLAEHIDDAYFTGVSVVDNIVEFLKNNPNMDYRNVRARARFN